MYFQSRFMKQSMFKAIAIPLVQNGKFVITWYGVLSQNYIFQQKFSKWESQ